ARCRAAAGRRTRPVPSRLRPTGASASNNPRRRRAITALRGWSVPRSTRRRNASTARSTGRRRANIRRHPVSASTARITGRSRASTGRRLVSGNTEPRRPRASSEPRPRHPRRRRPRPRATRAAARATRADPRVDPDFFRGFLFSHRAFGRGFFRPRVSKLQSAAVSSLRASTVLGSALFVFYCTAVGVYLLLRPWTGEAGSTGWTGSGFFRGFVSGLGLVHLLAG